MTRAAAMAAAVLVAACGTRTGTGSDSAEQGCAAINRWSFQEGNAISEHPDYGWWRRNCD